MELIQLSKRNAPCTACSAPSPSPDRTALASTIHHTKPMAMRYGCTSAPRIVTRRANERPPSPHCRVPNADQPRSAPSPLPAPHSPAPHSPAPHSHVSNKPTRPTRPNPALLVVVNRTDAPRAGSVCSCVQLSPKAFAYGAVCGARVLLGLRTLFALDVV
jgi:hypothetical protein